MSSYVSNNWQYFFAPAATATVVFGSSRLIAGTAGVISKKIGEYATPKQEPPGIEDPSFVGSNFISNTFKTTGDKLISFATRDSETEKKIIFTLAGLGFSTYFAANMLYNEGQVVAPPPNSLFTKFTESVGLTTPPTPLENIAATAERVVENVSEDPYLLASMPLGATIAGSLASRVVTGTLGTSAKVTSYAMNIIGLTNMGQSLSNTGDKLTHFATRNPRFELDAAIQIDTIKWFYSFF